MSPNYNRAARMAYKSLLAMHIDAFPVDPLLILRHCKNTHIHTYDEIMDRFGATNYTSFKYDCMENKDALILRQDISGKPVYELCYDNRGNLHRRRFTLAHELGHIVLSHHHEEWWEEKEADYFASQLLAPHPVVSYLPKSTIFLVDLFDISYKAAEIALNPPKHKMDSELSELYPQIEKAFISEQSAQEKHNVPAEKTETEAETRRALCLRI